MATETISSTSPVELERTQVKLYPTAVDGYVIVDESGRVLNVRLTALLKLFHCPWLTFANIVKIAE